jgi:hypothetical protein
MNSQISEKLVKEFRETLSDRVKDRTVGLELEYSNGDKEKIKLPLGYKFTDNKFSGHFNTTTVEIKNNGRFGGEINTKPIQLNIKDIQELKDLNQSIWDSGAKLNWYIEIHIHIYIKDMAIEEIRKINDAIFLLGNLNWKVFQIPEWNNTPYATPLMTQETHGKVDRSESISEVAQAFQNGSTRGFHRPYISMAQIESIGTMEYRHFSGSTDFDFIWEYIKFSYRFLDYCLSTTYEEKQSVKDEAEFIELMKMDMRFINTPMKPFIYAADPKDNTTNIGEMWNKSRPMLSAMKKAVGESNVFLYNSFNFDIEQALDKSNITVFSNNAYIHFMYDIINNNREFKFPKEFEFLDYSDDSTSADKIARILLFFDLIKKVDNKAFYAQRYFENTKANVDNVLRKMTEKASKLITNLQGRVTVEYGSFNDMAIAQKDEVIIYQYEEPSTMKALHNKVVKCFDVEMERLLNDYSLITKFKNYVFLSQNPYLPYVLNYTDGRYYVYSDRTDKSIHRITSRVVEPLYYKELPQDHVITEKSVIKFIRAKGSEVDYIRQKYLSKNIIMGSAVYNYLWFVDDYLFGACMLDYPRRKIGAGTVWLKSDFVIDSEVPKLSKLLIISILSEEFKKEVTVRFKENANFFVTNVFTTKPISMKYRGVFKLHTRESGKLIYVGEAGKYNRLNVEVLQKYLSSNK